MSRPEDSYDFKALYEERHNLERERQDLMDELKFTGRLLVNGTGSERQRRAWREGLPIGRLSQVNQRLIEIDTVVGGKLPEQIPWTPGEDFKKTIQQMIDDYNQKHKQDTSKE